MNGIYYKKQNQIPTVSLQDLCKQEIRKQLRILEHEITRLPYALINDIRNENNNNFIWDFKDPAFKVFINPGTTKLVLSDYFGQIKYTLPVNTDEFNQHNPFPTVTIDQICHVSKNVTHLNLARSNGMTMETQTRLIKNFPQLETITLSEQSTDQIVLAIANHCPRLRNLNFRYCTNITNKGIGYLCLNNNLKINYLDLRWTKVTSNGCLNALNAFKHLKVFKYNHWHNVFYQLQSQQTITPYNVQVINVKALQSKYFQVIINFFPKLRTVCMFESFSLNLPNALSFCSKIQNIRWHPIKFEPDVTLIGYMYPALKCLQLVYSGVQRFINFQHTAKLVPFRYLHTLELHNANSKEDLYKVLANCYKLETLRITYCDVLTDHVFKDLIQLNPLNNLKSLEIRNCNLISTKPLLMFLEMNKSLVEIRILNCELVEYKLLENCLKSKGFCKNVNIYPV